MSCLRVIVILLFLSPLSLNAQTVNRNDIVIGEIMSDPTPQVGLPNVEWIELINTSSSSINLQGWRIGDATGLSGPMPAFVLQPDSFVIVTTSSAVAAMSAFGRAISVTSFPSLDNEGEQLNLRSAQGRIIHAISYSKSWYRNPVKSEGGWTLEMVDTKNPCSGISNWKASVDPSGGTPGKRNSVTAANADLLPPQLKKAYTTDSVTIILVFDEPLDSTSSSITANYSVTNNIVISSATAITPMFTSVQLKLAQPLQRAIVYTITARSVTDCKGNVVGVVNSAKVGLPEDAAAKDVVINEILFNPRTGASDYVELYNRSNKIIDAGKLYIANRNSNGVLSSLKKISETPFYIFPGEYIAITEDAENLEINYLVKNKDAVLILSVLPSFPDDEGTVVLVNTQGSVVDEVHYFDDWHFDLIRDDEGVALERIEPDGPSQDKNNWHSAASTAGYGTPGYKNSQYKQPAIGKATIEILPKVFSPDNDGRDDFATISYQLNVSGYVANITIFNAAGRLVRHLVKNDILGLTGSWNWDGLDEKRQKLPVGTYIIYTELFNLQGKKERFKNVVVLARRLK
ncbi:MAG: lamin tail domain-containing protein [Chitinophagaceae bacterium]